MKLVKIKKSIISFSILFLLVVNAFSQEITWPRDLTNEGSTLTVYQPQVENWDNQEVLNYRMAFSLVPYQGNEVLGVAYMSGLTSVDMDTHMVSINNLKVMKADFPSLTADSVKIMEKVVSAFYNETSSVDITLEQVVACTPKEAPKKTVTLNYEAPIIFYSTSPTILLQLTGSPVMAAATEDETNLDYVVNSNFPLFLYKPSDTYYLYDGLEWRISKSIQGDWVFTNSVPKPIVNLPNNTNWTHLGSAFPAASEASKEMPKVYFSEKTAELILFEGNPTYTEIEGTSLKYATNTTSDVFFSSSNNMYYYLTSGRWFSASSLEGPWKFASQDLPKDFLEIPTTSPASSVLAHVPGTDEASDAVLIAQIPTTIKVNATEAASKVSITYSGEPQFKPIDSTNLSYAVNTTDKVIEVSDDSFYACVQGVWFSSSTANGPWVAAAHVPEAIYNMPPSSPVYNVTYVTQNINTNNEVVSTYTSGYMGAYVTGLAVGAVVMYGTGFYYPPYYYYPPMGYPVCFHYPFTYGCYAYHPYGYGYGNVAFHSSYNPATGAYGRSATAYGPYGAARVGQAYNPSTGTFARGASETNGAYSRGGAQAFNPYTGGSAASRQFSNPNGQWGSSRVTAGNGRTAYTGHAISNSGAEVAGKVGMNGAASVGRAQNGDMYASKDGNVYKNTGNGWESHGANGWNNTSQHSNFNGINNASVDRNNSNFGDLNNEFQNRQRGGMQAQQFAGRAGSFGGGGFSGGFGGGFRGRR